MTINRKNNGYIIKVFDDADNLQYLVSITNPETQESKTFPYRTAHNLSSVQQAFYDLTDNQCEKILKDSK